MLCQNTPLWHKDGFELKETENQQMQEGLLLLFGLKAGHELPLCQYSPLPNQKDSDSCYQRWRTGAEMSLHKQIL